MPWWGDRGIAPHLRWGEGVTIEIPAVWVAKRERWESPDGVYFFDKESADRACDFFPTFLTLHRGRADEAHTTFELMDYQKLLVIRPFFGWLNARTGFRRFRFILLFVPKGNGKSPLGAGVGLFLTLCDGQNGAEVYALAGDKEQATKGIHRDAKIMVQESADLLERCEVTRDSIYCAETKSYFQVLSAEGASKHGRRPYGTIIDELHNQKDRELFAAFRASMMKLQQPVFFMMSHAGYDDESLCFEEFENGQKVIADPLSDPAYLPVIFSATEKENWMSEAVHRRVNPAYGVTINPEIFQSERRAAQNEPRKKNDFLVYNLNRWTNQAVAWLPIEWWDACPATLPPDEALRKMICAGGIDAAQKIDLFAFLAVFKEPLDPFIDQGAPQVAEIAAENDQTGEIEKKQISLNYRLHILPMFWIPEDTMREHEKVDRVPYSLWVENGWVTKTEGSVIDYDRIFKDIVALSVRFPNLKQAEIGYDPAFATDLALRLKTKGFKVFEVLQNYKYMNEPCQVAEALLKAQRVTHDGNRCMRRCIENVAVKRDDAGRIRPVKPKKQSKRIDGVPAWMMALSRILVAKPLPTGPPVMWTD